MTLARAGARFGVPLAELRRARKQLGRAALFPSSQTLVLAALTRTGERVKGPPPDLAAIASWLDYVNHDGTTADEVRALLDGLVRSGLLALSTSGWRLKVAWPTVPR